MTSTHPEGQIIAGESLLVRLHNFVKLPHTLFALPFALLGVVAASFRAPVTARLVGLVVVAFTAARWVAMGFNRIADRRWDALNPRTRDRELPRGRLTLTQAWDDYKAGRCDWAAVQAVQDAMMPRCAAHGIPTGAVFSTIVDRQVVRVPVCATCLEQAKASRRMFIASQRLVVGGIWLGEEV